MSWRKMTCLPALLFIILLHPATGFGSDPLKTVWQELTLAPRISSQTLEPAINKFLQQQRHNRINNATIYSLALLEMAALPNLKDEVKRTLTTASIAISPDYSFPETALCKLLFQQQRYFASLSSLFRASRKFTKNPQESFYASTFFWLALAFTPLALFLLISLLIMLKYYRAFNEMGHIKLNRKGNLTLLALTIIIALLVMVFQAPLIGLLVLAGSLSLLTTRRDTIIFSLLIATLLIVPLAYKKGMASLLALDSSFFKAARHTTSGMTNIDDETILNQPATNQSQLVLQLFYQAEAARRRGEYATAEIFLEKIITNKVEIGAVYNNLANLYLLQKKDDSTIAYYQKASRLEKNSAVPYYNLSQLYIKVSFDLEKSTQALEMAYKIDPDLNQDPEGIREPDIKDSTKLIFMPLPDNVYRRFADSQPEKKTFLSEFLSQILLPGSTETIYYILIVLSLSSTLFMVKQAPGNRRLCSLCGCLFYPTRKLKSTNCPACRQKNLPTTASTLEKTISKTGHTKLKPFTLILHLGNIILPGFHQFMSGNIFLAFSMFLALLFWIYNFFICQTGIMTPFPPSTLWLTLVFPLLLWIINFTVLTLAHYRKQSLSSSRSDL